MRPGSNSGTVLRFHGKKTANGEIYNQNALTAAHRTLPMPSLVQVTNLENGRSLRLTVNDRGPFAHGRVIDASRRAAQLLGFHRKGTARVRSYHTGGGKPAVSQPGAQRKCHVGAHRIADPAQHEIAESLWSLAADWHHRLVDKRRARASRVSRRAGRLADGLPPGRVLNQRMQGPKDPSPPLSLSLSLRRWAF